jgi:hypothetical protein
VRVPPACRPTQHIDIELALARAEGAGKLSLLADVRALRAAWIGAARSLRDTEMMLAVSSH